MAVVTGGEYDLTTPEGRFTARIVGAVARKESEDRSRRARRKHLELAEQGRPAGQLGWGVRSHAERELVREAASRLLGGQGLMTNHEGLEPAGRTRSDRLPLDGTDAAEGAALRARRRPA